jgi:hypothetical protein
VGLFILIAIMAIIAAVLNRVLGRKKERRVMKTMQRRDTLRSVAVGVCMAAEGLLVARLHLHVFDRWYLRYGRIQSLPR